MLACKYTVEHARFKIPSFAFFPFSFFFPSAIHSLGCYFSIQLLFPTDCEMESSLSSQWQSLILYCTMAAATSGQLSLQTQLLLQR